MFFFFFFFFFFLRVPLITSIKTQAKQNINTCKVNKAPYTKLCYQMVCFFCLVDLCGPGSGKTCHSNAECVVADKYGRKRCKCKDGYEGDGVNECTGKPIWIIIITFSIYGIYP